MIHKMTLILCTGKGMTKEQYADFGNVVKCNFLECTSKWGLVGRGMCTNEGDFTDPECSQFADEKTWLQEWEDEECKQSGQ